MLTCISMQNFNKILYAVQELKAFSLTVNGRTDSHGDYSANLRVVQKTNRHSFCEKEHREKVGRRKSCGIMDTLVLTSESPYIIEIDDLNITIFCRRHNQIMYDLHPGFYHTGGHKRNPPNV